MVEANGPASACDKSSTTTSSSAIGMVQIVECLCGAMGDGGCVRVFSPAGQNLLISRRTWLLLQSWPRRHEAHEEDPFYSSSWPSWLRGLRFSGSKRGQV